MKILPFPPDYTAPGVSFLDYVGVEDYWSWGGINTINHWRPPVIAPDRIPPVAEPSTLALLVIGLVIIAAWRLRRA